MKNIKYIACCLFLFSATLQAQESTENTTITTVDLPTHVLDINDCGCNIDIDKILQDDIAYTQSIKVNINALTETFKRNKNRVAIDVIRRFSDNLPNVSIKQRIDEMNRVIGPKKDNAKEKWVEEFSAIASKASKIHQREVGYYLACQMAINLHQYYLAYPAEAGNAQAIEFYKRASTGENNTTSNNNTPASPLENIPEEARQFYSASQKQTPWFWIGLALSSTIIAAYLFATRKKDNSDEVDNLTGDLQIAREENQKLREKLAAKERDLETQTKQIAEYKDIVLLQQQELQQATQALKNANAGIQTTAPKTAVKTYYLSTPQENGNFLASDFQENFGQDSFYAVQIQAENTNIAKFELILSPSILQRAMQMPETYIFPVCELQGQGAMPNNPQQIQIQSGQLVRQDNTWVLAQKVILYWENDTNESI